jgi:hypothetical protein
VGCFYYYLNRQGGLGSISEAKEAVSRYLYLEADDDVDPSRGVERVDLREKVKGEERDKGINSTRVCR